jgi:hypothetical protein
MKRKAWAALLVALATCSAAAEAQDTQTPTTPPTGAARWSHAQQLQDLKQAEYSFRQAIIDEQAGQWDAALTGFTHARTLARKDTTQLLYHLGICHAKLGKVVTARDELVRAVARAQHDGRDDLATMIKAELADVQPRIASLALTRPTRGEVTAVTIDGLAATGKLGVAIDLDPGAHAVHVTYASDPPSDVAVTLAEGERRALPLPDPGTQVAPPASVAPPPASTPTPPAAPEGGRIAPEPPASSGMGAQRTWGLALGGAGLAGLGVGAVLAVTAGQPNHSDAATERDAAAGWLIAGGVLAVTGVVLFLTGGSSESSTASVHVVPGVGPGQAGVALLGAFP